jgi:hypothetical protein
VSRSSSFIERCLSLSLGLATVALLAGPVVAGVAAGAASSSGGGADAGTADAGAADAGAGVAADGGPPPADPVVMARQAMTALSQNVQLIQRIRAKAPRDSYSASCVTEKLAEAQIGLRLGDQEMVRLETSLARRDAGERAYALRRLQLLVERAATVLTAARACAAVDEGGITSTKVEVEIDPKIPQDDPTKPPPPLQPDMRPANDGR